MTACKTEGCEVCKPSPCLDCESPECGGECCDGSLMMGWPTQAEVARARAKTMSLWWDDFVLFWALLGEVSYEDRR